MNKTKVSPQLSNKKKLQFFLNCISINKVYVVFLEFEKTFCLDAFVFVFNFRVLIKEYSKVRK